MPLVVRGMTTKEAEEKCLPVIEMLGIGHRLGHKPSELSGGQKQRVSIARVLVGEPALPPLDIPGFFKLPYGGADCVDTFPVDL